LIGICGEVLSNLNLPGRRPEVLSHPQCSKRDEAGQRLDRTLTQDCTGLWKTRDSGFNFPLWHAIEVQEIERKIIVTNVQNIGVQLSGKMMEAGAEHILREPIDLDAPEEHQDVKVPRQRILHLPTWSVVSRKLAEV
jgi:hypothetical protein